MAKKKLNYFWFGVVIIVLIIGIFFFSNSKTEFNQTSSNQQTQNIESGLNPSKSQEIPILNYPCLDDFPEEVHLSSLTEFNKNNLSFIPTCQKDYSTGSNIYISNCHSGFFVERMYLPDGTIVNENYLVEYTYNIDERDCNNQICPVTNLECSVKNKKAPTLSDSDYLYYSQYPKYRADLASECDGCMSNDGKCIPVGKMYMGRVCTE